MYRIARWHNPEDYNLDHYVKTSSHKERHNVIFEMFQTSRNCSTTGPRPRITGPLNGVQTCAWSLHRSWRLNACLSYYGVMLRSLNTGYIMEAAPIIQNYWVFGLCPSSGILETRKHNVLETGFVSVLRWGGNTSTQLGPLESANLNHWTAPVKVSVRVTLRLAVYRQSVCFVDKPLETHDQHSFFFQLNIWGHTPYVTSSLTRGWVCHLQLMLLLSSAVIFRSESRGTHDHILLSQIRVSPNLEGQVPVLIPKKRVVRFCPVHWVPFSSPPTTRRATVEVFHASVE
jgi:hypothetical protein